MTPHGVQNLSAEGKLTATATFMGMGLGNAVSFSFLGEI